MDDVDNNTDISTDISILAIAKIAEELKNFKGGHKETVVKDFVASTLTKF